VRGVTRAGDVTCGRYFSSLQHTRLGLRLQALRPWASSAWYLFILLRQSFGGRKNHPYSCV